ncbi:MAG: hypothetical protein WD534_09005 [Phycisphaeraceae bacterium]
MEEHEERIEAGIVPGQHPHALCFTSRFSFIVFAPSRPHESDFFFLAAWPLRGLAYFRSGRTCGFNTIFVQSRCSCDLLVGVARAVPGRALIFTVPPIVHLAGNRSWTYELIGRPA